MLMVCTVHTAMIANLQAAILVILGHHRPCWWSAIVIIRSDEISIYQAMIISLASPFTKWRSDSAVIDAVSVIDSWYKHTLLIAIFLKDLFCYEAHVQEMISLTVNPLI